MVTLRSLLREWLFGREEIVSRKNLGRGEVHATPQPSSHCFMSQEERAAHWLKVWERFWSGE